MGQLWEHANMFEIYDEKYCFVYPSQRSEAFLGPHCADFGFIGLPFYNLALALRKAALNYA